MTFQIFETIDIRDPTRDALSVADLEKGKTGFNESRFYGSWIAGDTAGGSLKYTETFKDNPQFVISIQGDQI